jgi:hypothetical protein
MRNIRLIAIVAGLVTAMLSIEAPAMHHANLGRFLQRDPLGYVDGMGLYEYTQSNPLVLTDPAGGCSSHPKCGACCVDDLAFDSEEHFAHRPNLAGVAGFNFITTATLSIDEKLSPTSFQDCSFEWWEWGTHRVETMESRPRPVVPAQRWTKLNHQDADLAVMFAQLRKRKYTNPETITITDSPGGGDYGGGQHRFWAIRVKSGNAGCPNQEKRLYAHMELWLDRAGQPVQARSSWRALDDIPGRGSGRWPAPGRPPGF